MAMGLVHYHSSGRPMLDGAGPDGEQTHALASSPLDETPHPTHQRRFGLEEVTRARQQPQLGRTRRHVAQDMQQAERLRCRHLARGIIFEKKIKNRGILQKEWGCRVEKKAD